ncbi:MAG: hypothetical protein GKR95_11995 [Gammaproteobacteria bacterium]|nr:hypothetical protein [Gammaproteobacteria bacterium]NKB62799.1 hypothetical protein [Gammaproteobacteria bacterium]
MAHSNSAHQRTGIYGVGVEMEHKQNSKSLSTRDQPEAAMKLGEHIDRVNKFTIQAYALSFLFGPDGCAQELNEELQGNLAWLLSDQMERIKQAQDGLFEAISLQEERVSLNAR